MMRMRRDIRTGASSSATCGARGACGAARRAALAVVWVCAVLFLAAACVIAYGGVCAHEALAEDDEGSSHNSSVVTTRQQGTVSGTTSNDGTQNNVNKPEAPKNEVDTSVPIIDLEGNVVNGAQLPDSSFLYDTSIAALTSADSYYDGQVVQVIGEVVGDAVRPAFDNDHVWITLESTKAGESGSISVYMSTELANLVDGFGRYGVTGTMLQVRGVFHLACIEHDGITDLHAETASVVKNAKVHPDTFELSRFFPGLLLIIVGAVMVAVFHVMRERRR